MNFELFVFFGLCLNFEPSAQRARIIQMLEKMQIVISYIRLQ